MKARSLFLFGVIGLAFVFVGCTPNLDSSNPALEAETDQDVLAGIALDRAGDVSVAAAEKLTNQELLLEVITEAAYRPIRLAAVNGLRDQDLLAKLAIEGPPEPSDLGSRSLGTQALIVGLIRFGGRFSYAG